MHICPGWSWGVSERIESNSLSQQIAALKASPSLCSLSTIRFQNTLAHLLQTVFIIWNLRSHLKGMWVYSAQRFEMRWEEGVSWPPRARNVGGEAGRGEAREDLPAQSWVGRFKFCHATLFKTKGRKITKLKRSAFLNCLPNSFGPGGGATEKGEVVSLSLVANCPFLWLFHTPGDGSQQPHPVICKSGCCV